MIQNTQITYHVNTQIACSIMEFSQATLHACGEERHSKMKVSSLTSYPMRMSVSWSSVCI